MNLTYKKWYRLGLCALGLLLSVSANASVKDSVGVENKAGKKVILHKVEAKETLYSVARLYKANVVDIQKENPELSKGLAKDQVIRIPTNRAFAAKTPTTKPAATKAKTHVVEQGQTLFAVARQYNVSVDDIKKWNNLTSNELSAGQVLSIGAETKAAAPDKPTKPATTSKTHVVEQGQTLFAVAREYNVTVDDLKKWNNLTTLELSAGQVLNVGDGKATQVAPDTRSKPATQPAAPKEEKKEDKDVLKVEPAKTNAPAVGSSNTVSVGGYDRVIEKGLAEVIEQGGETKKHLCLHRTAPIGSILQVKNEMNGSMVFVRVIGKLPDTGTNDKLLLRISKKAYERLSASGKRFQVEVSYPAP